MKLKKNILLFSFFLFTFLFAYEINAQARGLVYRQLNSVDFAIGGAFGYRMIGGDKSNPETLQKINNRNESEDIKLNYRIGFNYNHGIGSRMLIKAGIRFSNPGFRAGLIRRIDPLEDINQINKEYLEKGFEYKYNYQLIEIPIGLKYVFSGSWCKSYLEFGVAPSFYTKTVVAEKLYEAGSTNYDVSENINSLNYFGFFATGGDFTITDNLSGFSQLIAHYQLNNLRKGDVKEKLLSLGMELGVRYLL